MKKCLYCLNFGENNEKVIFFMNYFNGINVDDNNHLIQENKNLPGHTTQQKSIKYKSSYVNQRLVEGK